jgi:murein DD-endopeptidase MepM/ murein hydrolase activator NlpD
MKNASVRRALPIVPMAICFVVGIAVGWWLHASGGPRPVGDPTAIHLPIEKAHPPSTVAPAPPSRGDEGAKAGRAANVETATSATPAIGAAPRGAEPGGAIEVLQRHRLQVPVDGVKVEAFKGAFAERRSGEGGHTHEAVDILAPLLTPVRAVEDGTIAKLFDSKAGGHTIYQFDPTERFAYYYAHLDRYANGLHDGQRVAAGEVIGYVGTSGNAPPGTPHLHFAIFELGPEKRWWKGEAIDPYLVFKR